MSRRKRIDGMAGRTEIVQGAISGPPAPPTGVTISKEVQPFWEIVTMAKAKRAWTQNDLVVAADIAKGMCRLEKIHAHLETMPVYSDDPEESKEIEKIEKRADLIAKRIRILSSHVQIHSDATQGKTEKQREQNKMHHEALNSPHTKDDDSLIAKPLN